jgi:hypothetical protein
LRRGFIPRRALPRRALPGVTVGGGKLGRGRSLEREKDAKPRERGYRRGWENCSSPYHDARDVGAGLDGLPGYRVERWQHLQGDDIGKTDPPSTPVAGREHRGRGRTWGWAGQHC